MKRQSTTTNLQNKIKTSVLCTICVMIFFSCGENGGTEEDVLPDPVACFEYDPADELKAGDEISFTNCSENATSYVWDFGDGDVSTDENPTHSYDEFGSFTVTLVATNESSVDEISVDIEIIQKECKIVSSYYNSDRWDNGYGYTYEYDQDGNISAIVEEDGGETWRGEFTYSNGKLVSGFDELFELEYDGDLISKFIRNYTDDLSEWRFFYDNERLIKVEYWDYNYELNAFEFDGVSEFSYANENVVRVESSNGTTVLTYDDKPNPFYGNLALFLDSHDLSSFLSRNNIIKSTSSTGTSDYSYNYNEQGLPVLITITQYRGDDVSVNTEELTYDCD